ncbi:hypothetical protein [Chryseobacterium sp. G0201]|uniref:hypothetical protein n=1 Tax=Chryseobacterium sp. G0201 TaxID=2487065 RepID=UPI000F508E5B|nr:hypothetical protein [Chryseobacterium sp. G0201]AZA53724.1 hypothetical protein EG348_12240 [Chryseobacterium sp. G0201]
MTFENLPETQADLVEKNNQNLPEKKTTFDIETFKSIYYWANAKPDTQLKLFRGRKTISLSDIHDLNTRIGNKLKNYNIETFLVTLNFVLTEGNIREYSSWDEFNRENWQFVNQRIQTISITWDLTFSIPNYHLPQRHTLKVRIGSAIPPKDLFHFMFNTDETSDLLTLRAEGMVKVDFINQVLGNELINIATEWNEGLTTVERKNNFQSFLQNNERYINKSIIYFFPLLILFLGFIYQNLIIKELDLSKDLNLITLERTLLIGATITSIGLVLSRFIANQFSRRIDKFKMPSGILITKGDKIYDEELKIENKTIIKDILGRVLISLTVAIVIIGLKYIYTYFFSNKS